MSEAWFWSSDFAGADLEEAWLARSNFEQAVLKDANLVGADLTGSILVGAQLNGANLNGCRVFGTSIWKCELQGAQQSNLVITPEDEPDITVDNLKVAQFIYLLMNNSDVREVIDTITSKVVLILGSFKRPRKAVLDAMRDALRRRGYCPVMFDFDKPTSRTTDETVTLLARMARFIIADLTDAKSVLQELRGIVPECPSVPVQTLIEETQHEPGMFDFFAEFAQVLPTYQYRDSDALIGSIDESVIRPAEARTLERRRSDVPSST